MGLFGKKKKVKDDPNGEWTSFEFVEFLIKYPDTSNDNFVQMYSNLVGEDNLEKDMANYWKERLAESFINQKECEKIKEEFNQRFEKIRILYKQKYAKKF
jgi:hypothetical protein